MRNVSRFRLRTHTLKVETAAWDTQNALMCDRCSCDEIQDEAYALLVKQPFLQQVSVQGVSDFLLQHNTKLFLFVSELMDIMLIGKDQSQADQPNSLAEGPPM
eukprot:125274-Pelagomonas_calceolata.AAC.1